MNPLALLFGTGARTRNALYDRGFLKPRRLQGPVVSIGNLSVGGTGKTPFIIVLGELLKQRGIKFDVLSRGYGRQSKGVRIVDPAGTAREFGDEPLLISRRLGVPMIVGEDRYQAGIAAEKAFGPQLHLLDDGFQHRALARDFDIVLVTPEDATDRLLPAGRLREPLSSLKRADAVVLSWGATPEALPVQAKLVWQIRRGIFVKDIPEKPIAFCGIAHPKKFLLQLKLAGIELVGEALFRDHHPYTQDDVQQLLKMRAESEAGGFVTTEKDAINLEDNLKLLDPVAVIPVKMELVNGADAVDTILRTIEERRRPS
ncbi:MAG TPA: tetraacyldisaccharide 4'-kinase [Terriglobales bacterium]|nr:tetraacyldisaccharide 4'-kinase [Terriglobales bacterium]